MLGNINSADFRFVFNLIVYTGRCQYLHNAPHSSPMERRHHVTRLCSLICPSRYRTSMIYSNRFGTQKLIFHKMTRLVIILPSVDNVQCQLTSEQVTRGEIVFFGSTVNQSMASTKQIYRNPFLFKNLS